MFQMALLDSCSIFSKSTRCNHVAYYISTLPGSWVFYAGLGGVSCDKLVTAVAQGYRRPVRKILSNGGLGFGNVLRNLA